ncbi:traub family protein [Schizosaccharomyces japonicus yFS275]|uniref:Protein BFR2 n=1 Tax=Schizosaccharomyces japonicus (strain yFS275 / FY16936) TaxID=402676 RepID=B6JYE3_SCHJY|nr:traub family protein [Schizosaccharomyces japonicus yFS275]EEB06561.1 traub family protein [Schizosaccharomyces japonicus yFS275]
MTTKSTLSKKIGDLFDVRPTEKDPESLDTAFSDGESSSEEQNNAGTEHYVDVGPSALRQKQAPALDPKFKAKKVSRKDVFKDEKEDNEEDGESEEGQSDESEDELEEESVNSFSESEEASEAEEESEVDSESEPESESESTGDSTMDKVKKLLESKQEDLSLQLKASAVENVKKGKALKEQIRLYNRLLDSRIRLQKGFLAIRNVDVTNEDSKQETADARSAIVNMLHTTMKLRRQMLEGCDVDTSALRKRKFDAVDTDTVLDNIRALDSSASDWKNEVLTKWYNRTQLSQNAGSGNKFKALNQDAVTQIDQAMLRKDELVQRTRIDRSGPTVSSEPNTEIFDDTDFYQSLLRDLINSRMADSTTAEGVRWVATKRQKQKKENVDTKASKGRKLRYHVHEKIRNFMVPIETGSWTDEQKDDLFNSLLGQQVFLTEQPATNEGLEQQQGQEEVLVDAGFKLFG